MVEGALENIPSIGFSLTDTNENADFSLKKVVSLITKKVLKNGIKRNLSKCKYSKCR